VSHRKLFPGAIVLATHNEGKVREIEALLGPYGMEPVSAGRLGLPEPEETEDTFAGNALLKARAASEASGMVALSDDSGIEVAALGGQPGVYTADWATQPDGTRDWLKAMEKVETALPEGAARDAAFVCTLALVWPDGHSEVFEGRAPGHLVWPPRGERGFGYDPVFVPTGHDRTYAEMDPAEKHAISHRADAFAKLVAACF
jgi:XTP/dITP diphosphohydrolase